MAHPGGRPTKYSQEWVEKVRTAFNDGSNIQRFCRDHDIHHDTFYEWCKKYPEFSEAFKEGKQRSQAFWLDMGINNLNSKTFNTNLYKYLTAVQFGWSENKNVTQDIVLHDGKEAKEVQEAREKYTKPF